MSGLAQEFRVPKFGSVGYCGNHSHVFSRLTEIGQRQVRTPVRLNGRPGLEGKKRIVGCFEGSQARSFAADCGLFPCQLPGKLAKLSSNPPNGCRGGIEPLLSLLIAER